MLETQLRSASAAAGPGPVREVDPEAVGDGQTRAARRCTTIRVRTPSAVPDVVARARPRAWVAITGGAIEYRLGQGVDQRRQQPARRGRRGHAATSPSARTTPMSAPRSRAPARASGAARGPGRGDAGTRRGRCADWRTTGRFAEPDRGDPARRRSSTSSGTCTASGRRRGRRGTRSTRVGRQRVAGAAEADPGLGVQPQCVPERVPLIMRRAPASARSGDASTSTGSTRPSASAHPEPVQPRLELRRRPQPEHLRGRRARRGTTGSGSPSITSSAPGTAMTKAHARPRRAASAGCPCRPDRPRRGWCSRRRRPSAGPAACRRSGPPARRG